MVIFKFKDVLAVRVMIAESGSNIRGFAEDIEVTPTYLSMILNQRRNPSPKIALKIAEGLGQQLGDIFFVDIDNKSYRSEIINQ